MAINLTSRGGGGQVGKGTQRERSGEVHFGKFRNLKVGLNQRKSNESLQQGIMVFE